MHFIYGLIMILALCNVFASEVVLGTEIVSVDLGSDKGMTKHVAAGILHSIAPDKPLDKYVLPLKLKTLRMKPYASSEAAGAIANCPRATKIGAQIMLILSDRTGYGAHGWWPGDDGNWQQWEDTIRNQIKQTLQTECEYIYDIWNEPDIPPFWSPEGTKQEKVERFFETWKRAYAIIRELAPNSQIVGPSIAYFDNPKRSMFKIEQFLLYARDNDVLPDILSWHEGWKPDTVEPRIEYIKTFMSENDIDIKHISISEYGGLYDQFAPGVYVQYFAALERAGVISAVKTTWPEEQGGCSNAWNATLGGLVTYPQRKPRSNWWAYKGYAQVSGQFLKVDRADTVDGIAAFDSDAEEVTILLGRDAQEISEEVILEIKGIDRRRELVSAFGQICVKGYRIPDTGKEELLEMVLEFERKITLGGADIHVKLPDFGKTDAYFLKLLNPDTVN